METCPFGCDKALYAAVLELREKRLDEEDRLNDIQKIIDVGMAQVLHISHPFTLISHTHTHTKILKKEYDAHLKKERTMDASLRQIENEIQEFHAMKQKKFNELEVCIPLRPHQIQFLDGNGRISTEMSNAVVFLSSGLHHLRGRISDLQQEKADIRKQHNQLKKMHVNLVKNRKEKQLKLGELENRLYEVQMLKFGRVVDLERLEKLGLNKAADEMRDKLNKEDQQRNKQLQTWDNQIMELREEYNNILIRNTELLEGLVEKRKARKQMESTLNVKQSAVVGVMRVDTCRLFHGLCAYDIWCLTRLYNTDR